ncbi:M14 family metallopeptidase [Govanella unica]|uniref:M14 family metallopeptidase n=1 Tax=Govanella unica TaxID=2975056 RepID=A0A9X3Z604_9PROT|nr:M14 family metallopeptidase [Govania unica]MDA5192675.1 M14 family metallopeptidase [Govania unica]
MSEIFPFAMDYAAARAEFLSAAATAGARLVSAPHGLKGPAGETLASDVAWLGPETASAVLVLLSGTHGIEGVCGSGCQTAWLRSEDAGRLPDDVAVMLVHAVNPHGFAYMRRVNEDNIDINRNWIDFARPLPLNAAYTELRTAICPADWYGPGRDAAEARLRDYAAAHGERALQAVITGGQWSDPSGVFYGGRTPSWSRQTLAMLLTTHLARARRIALLDIHTGLGAYGACEMIVPAAVDSAGFGRARSFYGLGLTSPASGTSHSAPVVGDMLSGVTALLSHAEVTAAALEFGVQPTQQMITAVRADAWLHAHGAGNIAAAASIAAKMRDAFIGETLQWEGMVAGQTLHACRQAVAGLCGQ